MKKFSSFINEEVMPTAFLHDSSIDIEKDAVRQEINGILAHCTMSPCVTPYVALRRISKALAYFHIYLPKRAYFEGDRGVEVYEVKQFGERMGVTDTGEWIHHVPTKYHLVFRYRLMGASFFVTAKIVDGAGLDKELDRAEEMVAEARKSKKVSPPWNGPDRIAIDNHMNRVRKLAQNAMKRQINKSKTVKEGMLDTIRSGVDSVKSSIAKSTGMDKLGDALTVKGAQAAPADSGKIMGFNNKKPSTTPKDGSNDSAFPANEECGCGTDMETASERRAPKEKLKSVPSSKRGKLEEVSKGDAISAYREKEAQERDTGKLHGLIKRKWGEKTAHNAERAGAQSSVGLIRRGEDRGKEDSISRDRKYQSDRKTKSGKIHKQDVSTLKGNIKRRLGSHTKARLSEGGIELGPISGTSIQRMDSNNRAKSLDEPKKSGDTTMVWQGSYSPKSSSSERITDTQNSDGSASIKSVKKSSETINEISQKLALKAMKASEKRSDDEWEADAAYDRLSDWKTHDARAHRLRGHMKRKFGKKKIKTDGEDHLKDYDGYSGRQGVHTVNTHGKRAGLPPKEQVNRLKSNIKYSLGKHHKPNLPEETQIDEVSKKLLGRYIKGASHDVATRSALTGRHAVKSQMAAKDQDYNQAKIHDKLSDKAFSKSWDRRKHMAKAVDRLTKEDTQIDEISRGTVARYKKAAESDKRSAESSAETSRAHRKNRALPLSKRNAFHDEEKWLKGIAAKRAKGISMADKRLNKE